MKRTSNFHGLFCGSFFGLLALLFSTSASAGMAEKIVWPKETLRRLKAAHTIGELTKCLPGDEKSGLCLFFAKHLTSAMKAQKTLSFEVRNDTTLLLTYGHSIIKVETGPQSGQYSVNAHTLHLESDMSPEQLFAQVQEALPQKKISSLSELVIPTARAQRSDSAAGEDLGKDPKAELQLDALDIEVYMIVAEAARTHTCSMVTSAFSDCANILVPSDAKNGTPSTIQETRRDFNLLERTINRHYLSFNGSVCSQSVAPGAPISSVSPLENLRSLVGLCQAKLDELKKATGMKVDDASLFERWIAKLHQLMLQSPFGNQGPSSKPMSQPDQSGTN